MVQIKSSIIKSVGYEGDTLSVEFNNNQIYKYSKVSPGVYNALIAASSPGRHFIDNIKNSYDYKRA